MTNNAQVPYSHQLDGIDLLQTNKRYALFWECGVGKTLPVVRVMDKCFAEEQCDICIIVAPKVALYNWVAEIKLNANEWSDIFVLDGTPDEREQELSNAWDCEKPVVILNYALLTRHLDKLTEWAEQNRIMLVLDESHYIKNQAAKRTKAAIKLADGCAYVILLTGTPIGRDIGDVWSQYRAMDGGETFGKSWYRFRNSFMVRVPHIPGMWAPKKGSSDKIKQLMWRKADYRSKNDCLDLPERTHQHWIVEPPKQMRTLYNKLARDFVAQYQMNGQMSRVRAANAAAAIVKLQQVTSGFIKNTEGDNVELEWQPKLDTIDEIAAQVCGSEKLVVWARFLRDIAILLERLEPYNPLSIEAQHSSEYRAQTMDLFNQDNDHRVLVSNPACGGVAINLQGASTAVYYSNDYNYIHRVQSEDRLHRIGQRKVVRYIDLVIPGTIDDAVLSNLQAKGSMVDYIQNVGVEAVVLPKGEDLNGYARRRGQAGSIKRLGRPRPEGSGVGRERREKQGSGPKPGRDTGTPEACSVSKRVSDKAGSEESTVEAGKRPKKGDRGTARTDTIPVAEPWW